MEIIAIIGSRAKDKDKHQYVRSLVGPRVLAGDRDKTVFISGGCPTGADYWCRYFCNQYNRKYLEAPAFWQKPDSHGKPFNTTDLSAGHRRNRLIVDICTKVIAFWDGHSPGTAKTVDYARGLGKPVEVVPV